MRTGYRRSGSQTPWRLAVVVLILATTAVLVPDSPATAEPTEADPTWSVPLRYYGIPTPRPDGGVIVNTATAVGGVPSGGDSLVGIDSTGEVGWRVPYIDQEVISDPVVVDNQGHHYWIRAYGSVARLIASEGATERWHKDITGSPRLVVGANGVLYAYDPSDRLLHGYRATDGAELFPPVMVSVLPGYGYDTFVAYDKGWLTTALTARSSSWTTTATSPPARTPSSPIREARSLPGPRLRPPESSTLCGSPSGSFPTGA
jgi:hypothetical protein